MKHTEHHHFARLNHHARTIRLALLSGVACSALLLGACSRHDEPQTAGEKLDSAVASARSQADEAKRDIQDSYADAKRATEAAADKTGDTLKGAAHSVASAVDDATVTAAVNAELAKDPKLSALKIDVDTDHGHVALSGTAPDSNSRDRATQLARAVKGVVSVDNRLQVEG